MERAVPVLPGDDLGEMKAFYVGKLGFAVVWEDTRDGRTGLAGIERGTIELMLDCPMSGHGRDVCVSLRVDDADATYETWRDVASRPPMDEAWGGRTFGVTDPAGNLLYVVGPVRDGERGPP